MCSEHVSKVQGVSRRAKGLPMEAKLWCLRLCKVDNQLSPTCRCIYLLLRFSVSRLSPPVAFSLSRDLPKTVGR